MLAPSNSVEAKRGQSPHLDARQCVKRSRQRVRNVRFERHIPETCRQPIRITAEARAAGLRLKAASDLAISD